MTQGGRAVIEGFLTAYRARDAAGQFSRMHPDILIAEPPGLPYGGDWRGHDGWRRLTRAIRETWALEPTGETQRIFDGDNGVDYVLMTRLKGRSHRSGERLDMTVLEHWRVEDGLITLIRPHYYDSAAAARIDGRAVAAGGEPRPSDAPPRDAP